jgi:hypothetical protein
MMGLAQNAVNNTSREHLNSLLGKCVHKQHHGLFTLPTSSDNLPEHLAAMKAYMYCTGKAAPRNTALQF